MEKEFKCWLKNKYKYTDNSIKKYCWALNTVSNKLPELNLKDSLFDYKNTAELLDKIKLITSHPKFEIISNSRNINCLRQAMKHLLNYLKDNTEILKPSYEAIFESEDKMPKHNNYTNPPLNQILYGPPGTGKSYNTIVKAMEIIGLANDKPITSKLINEQYDNLKDKIKNKNKEQYSNEEYTELKAQFDKAKENHQIEFVTFHQSYSYEEFVEGIKPVTDENDWTNPTDKLKYSGKDGIFKQICENATKHTIDNFDEVYEQFTNRIAECDEDDYYKIYTLKNNKVFGLKINGNNNLNVYLTENFNKQGVITKDNLRKYFEQTRIAKDWKNYYESIVEHLKEEYKLVAQKSEYRPHVLIIDEINRGNISKIFGELITLIEPDKRKNITGDNNDKYHTLEVTLPYSQQKDFGVPNNLYIIGTMNTSDRSIASIDIALRRRFKFIEMMPKSDKINEQLTVFGLNVRNIFETLNKRIKILLDRDHQIGHSYFMKLNNSNNLDDDFKNIWFDEIMPLLNEYFYGDWEKLQGILGEAKADDTSFIQKTVIDNKKDILYSGACDENEYYDFASEDELNFEEALKYAFGTKSETDGIQTGEE